jgi:hypothetical protein
VAADAEVDGDLDRLVAEIVGYCQALQAPAIDQAVGDEIHAPHLVDVMGHGQWLALTQGPLGLAAFPDCQPRLLVDPVDLLVIDPGKLGPDHVVDSPVAEAPPFMGDLDDPSGKCAGRLVLLGRVAIGIAGKPHQTTGMPLG